MWFDAHAHLQVRYIDGALDDLHATLERMSEAAVEGTVIIGTDVASSLEALEIASLRHAGVELYATAGIHPHDATNDIDELRRAVANEIATRGRERLVGIGECGLDYYYEHSPRDDQRRTFAAQIALAHEHDLALVIHARDAWDDLFDVLATESTPPRTVIHCFTGGPEDAERCLGAGCDISISGVVTFKNAQNVRDALRVVPLERLHVETDSPFLAPVPHRGRTNEPSLVSVVGAFVAHELDLAVEALAKVTVRNTRRLFALP